MGTMAIMAALGETVVRVAKYNNDDSAAVEVQNVIGVLKAISTLIEDEAERLNSIYIDDLKKQAAA